MEIKTQNTKNDYKDFLKYYYFKRNLTGRIIIPLCIILLITYNATFKVHYYFWENFLFLFIILTLLFFLLFYLLPYLISIWRVSKRFKANNNAEINNFSFIPEGIDITTQNENKFCSWKEIKFINTYNNNFFLRFYNNGFYLLPKNAFQSKEEKGAFFSMIQTQIQKNKFRNVNRLYCKGWFGLIPLVGAFVGMWLIGEGVSKYKDKKLISIGIACILFTVIFYSSLFYYFKYSEQFRKDNVPFSKIYLNSLVKDIEFYKSQKGYYPNSLEDLLFTDKMVMINDPILNGENSPNNDKFYYKKLGDKYTLFSCGIDKIPNTSDDIFPSMDNLDTSKIGFIKAE